MRLVAGFSSQPFSYTRIMASEGHILIKKNFAGKYGYAASVGDATMSGEQTELEPAIIRCREFVKDLGATTVKEEFEL